MKGRLWHSSMCEERASTLLRLRDYQAADEHMCGLLRYSLYGTRDALQNCEEELASTLSKLKLTIRGRVLMRVARSHQR